MKRKENVINDSIKKTDIEEQRAENQFFLSFLPSIPPTLLNPFQN